MAVQPLKRAKTMINLDNLPVFQGPFRLNVQRLISRHALTIPSVIPQLQTCRISFADVGDLFIIEEDVKQSRHVNCDNCKILGWVGNPVCIKRYHFIIRNPECPMNTQICSCGTIQHWSKTRCSSCNHELTVSAEDWAYNQLEDSNHLLHGVVHANGYGHLLRINGREGGSRSITGYKLVEFWDRLCKLLHVRKVSVMDVSQKYGMEYRLLHGVMKGCPWYGNWGYEFGIGCFAATLADYERAIHTLSSMPLSIFSKQEAPIKLKTTIAFYLSLSKTKLGTARDLFCFITELLRDSREKNHVKECDTEKKETKAPAKISRPSREHLLNDLKFLYNSLLNPVTMQSYPKSLHQTLVNSALKLLDCKHFIKHYDKNKDFMPSKPFFLVTCHLELADKPKEFVTPPPELILLPITATVADLKLEAEKIFQETYLVFDGFQAEQVLVNSEVINDDVQINSVVCSNNCAKVRGKCFHNRGMLEQFCSERGIDDGPVNCTCGSKDDDGERLLACDDCGVWKHTRCVGIKDFELVPTNFQLPKYPSHHPYFHPSPITRGSREMFLLLMRVTCSSLKRMSSSPELLQDS